MIFAPKIDLHHCQSVHSEHQGTLNHAEQPLAETSGILASWSRNFGIIFHFFVRRDSESSELCYRAMCKYIPEEELVDIMKSRRLGQSIRDSVQTKTE